MRTRMTVAVGVTWARRGTAAAWLRATTDAGRLDERPNPSEPVRTYFLYVFINPFREFVTVIVPSGRALILIQYAGVCAAAPPP